MKHSPSRAVAARRKRPAIAAFFNPQAVQRIQPDCQWIGHLPQLQPTKRGLLQRHKLADSLRAGSNHGAARHAGRTCQHRVEKKVQPTTGGRDGEDDFDPPAPPLAELLLCDTAFRRRCEGPRPALSISTFRPASMLSRLFRSSNLTLLLPAPRAPTAGSAG
jgi:hypothetical protein